MNRLVKRRRGARVVVIAGNEVLLQADTDPGVPGSLWWVTPGGGVDADEDPVVAAARELFEETGFDADPALLLGPVATRVVTHGYSDRILVQEEVFFQVRVERFRPNPAGLTVSERQRMTAQRWFRVDALPSPLWPAQLPRLLNWAGGRPLDLGHHEESTVPVPGGPVALDLARFSAGCGTGSRRTRRWRRAVPWWRCSKSGGAR